LAILIPVGLSFIPVGSVLIPVEMNLIPVGSVLIPVEPKEPINEKS
jgi:hypothetical protein